MRRSVQFPRVLRSIQSDGTELSCQLSCVARTVQNKVQFISLALYSLDCKQNLTKFIDLRPSLPSTLEQPDARHPSPDNKNTQKNQNWCKRSITHVSNSTDVAIFRSKCQRSSSPNAISYVHLHLFGLVYCQDLRQLDGRPQTWRHSAPTGLLVVIFVTKTIKIFLLLWQTANRCLLLRRSIRLVKTVLYILLEIMS